MSLSSFKGITLNLTGEVPGEGEIAPDFKFVKTDLSEQSLYEIKDKIKVLIVVPSLDTNVCALETKKFNDRLQLMEYVQGIVISKDLPFAMKRFNDYNGIKSIMAASDFRYNEFGKKYGADFADGPLAGLTARIVLVVDEDNIVRYREVVEDVGNEPDYDKIIEVVQSL